MRSSLLLLSLLAFGCSTPPEPIESSKDDLTSIAPSVAVQQAVPNCWVFGTTSWLESLSTRPVGGVQRDLSEAYVSYFYWFEQIARGSSWVEPTGWWSIAVETMHLYGWMDENVFLSLPTPVDYAQRHKTALEAIHQELTSGMLSTFEQRADRKNIVAALNKAWGLTPEIAADIARVFGEGYEKSLQSPEVDSTGSQVHRLSEILVGYSNGQPVTANDVIGDLDPNSSIWDGKRVGPFAFSEVFPPDVETDTRAWLRRMQTILHQDVPVVMAEWSDDAQVDASGTYRRPAQGLLTSGAYAHVVTVFDYSVNTREFGLLPVGVPETRPEALSAALLDDSQIVSFRTRNSWWGSYDQGATMSFAGANGTSDFSLDYLMMSYPNFWGSHPVIRVTLPNNPDLVLTKSP